MKPPPPKIPIHILLDFDQTITDRDTIHLLSLISISSNDSQQKWDGCVAAYIADCNAHIASYSPIASERKAVDEEIAFQRSLREVEKRSVDRISAEGLFAGVSRDEWYRAGKKAVSLDGTGAISLKLRDGLQDFVTAVLENEGKWGVVSVNWCQAWIRGVLGLPLPSRAGPEEVPVLSNDIDPERGLIMGPHGGRILISEDKKRAMDCVLSRWEVAPSNHVAALTVYIGDSPTDIECLLGVDVGIIISKDGSGTLIETLARCGITVGHVGLYKPSKEKTIWWARDFVEIKNRGLMGG